MNRPLMARLQLIDARIRSGRFPNARTLAQELEVSVRTVQRDLELLRDQLGAPLAYDPRRRGYYYTRTDFVLPAPPVSPMEVAALQTAAHLLRLVAGSPFEGLVRGFIDRLVASMPEAVTVDSQGQGDLSFGLPAIRGDEAHVTDALEILHEALVSRQTVAVHYYSAYRDAWRHRYIDPYHLHYRGGAWYVIGRCHWRRRILVFAVDRMRDLRLTGRRFTVEPGFSARKFLETAWELHGGDPVEVQIRFRPPAARYIRERRWHPSQELQEGPEGSLVLKLKVAGLAEVARWVLQFGSSAEVLAPAALREMVVEEISKMVAVYSSSAATSPTPRAIR